MKSNKLFILIVILGAVAAFMALMVAKPGGPTVPEGARGTIIDESLLVKEHSPIKGAPEAPITIVEFLDPECEACRALNPMVSRLLKEYSGKIRVVIRYMPFHGNSKWAACAIEEARAQGKFGEALDYLFETQPAWGGHGEPRPELIAHYLKEIGIDPTKLDREALLQKHGWKVDLDEKDGRALGVRVTPTFFVDGQKMDQLDEASMKAAIDAAIARQSLNQ